MKFHPILFLKSEELAMSTVQAFTSTEYQDAKLLLAAQVARMDGRKLEEGDWQSVYCAAKGIQDSGWSNLKSDVESGSLGIESKLFCCGRLRRQSITSMCGKSKMHPSATRAVELNTSATPNDAMHEIMTQYADWIASRTDRLRQGEQDAEPDMRFGWLLWEPTLSEFLYWEEPMNIPSPDDFYAEWQESNRGGNRRDSRSLWIFQKSTGEKRYSVSSTGGTKIQPYFDVPDRRDPNLFYFRVQREPLDTTRTILWLHPQTANLARRLIGDVSTESIENAIRVVAEQESPIAEENQARAVSVPVSNTSVKLLERMGDAVSDDAMVRQLLERISET
jgi:hypothetical protein